MSRATAPKKQIRTGVSLSPTGVRAADIRLRDGVWHAQVEPPTESGTWPSLANALAELAKTLGATGGTLAVSLLPPLAEVRGLELPPLRDDEVHRLLARGAARYFVNARGPQVVGATCGRRVKGTMMPVVAAAASARLVSAIRAAAEQSGWRIESVAPAENAWAAAGIAVWPAFGKQRASLIVAHQDRTDLLQLDAGRLAGVRRFRAGAADAAMIAEAVGRGSRTGVIGDASRRGEIVTALAPLGVTVTVATGKWSGSSPEDLAATFAGADTGPIVRTEDAVALDQARWRRRAWIVGGAAVVMAVAAAGVELWGVHRQLALVQRERAALRPQLAQTLVGRTTVEATYRNLTALAAVERAGPQWSSVIGALTDAVPDDAHLTAIRGREDSLVVDGLAGHAARVFDALSRSRMFTDVSAPAPVRREPQDNGPPLDHFTIAARIAAARVAP